MIGAPVTAREKAIFYTIGLPFLFGSMSWYRVRGAASAVASRIKREMYLRETALSVRAEVAPVEQVALGLSPLVAPEVGPSRFQGGRLTIWVPEESVGEYALSFFLWPHEVALLKLCFDENSTRVIRLGRHLAVGPGRIRMDIFGPSVPGDLGGGVRYGINWFEVENIAELRVQLSELKT